MGVWGLKAPAGAGRSPASSSGFSLIEVLCAMTILALVMTVVLRILSGGLTAARLADQRGRALAVAEAHLAELLAADQPPGGVRDGVEAGLRWQETVVPAADPAFAESSTVGLAALSVSVRVVAPDGRAVSLRTVKLLRSG